jgi:hypothetical protein
MVSTSILEQNRMARDILAKAAIPAALLAALSISAIGQAQADNPMQGLLLNSGKGATAGSAARSASLKLAPGQAKAGPQMGDLAHMAGAGKLVPAELSYNGHVLTISIPGDFFLSEYLLSSGKVFSFKGMPHEDKSRAILNVTVVPDVAAGPGALIDGERGMIDVILAAPRKDLKNYKEEKLPLFMSATHSFKGLSFEGLQANGKNVKGFVYVTQAKDTFFIIFGQDELPFAEQSIPLLLKQARACRLP